MKYALLAMLAFCYGFFVFNRSVLAAEYTLVISEVAAGIGTAGNEFVEIHNYGDLDIKLKEEGIKLKLISSSGAVTTKTIIWTNEIIPAHGFFLFGAGTLDISFDALYGGTLLAGNGGVIIADKNDDVIDEITWTGLTTGCSMERTAGNVSQNDFSSFFLQASPNPQNSASAYVLPPSSPSPKNYSHNISLNELLPNPSETPEKNYEYIEIYNFGNEDIDLSGWKIKDKSSSYKLSGIVEGGDYAVFYGAVSLNNDGDEITLVDPNEETVSQISYSKAPENSAYARKNEGEWKWTSHLTPGAENIFDENIKYPEKVYLNEILPNPQKSEEEYIELFNSGTEDIDLFKWILKDSGKNTKYIFPENSKIKSQDYLVVKRKDFKFAMNNSGEEEVSLLDPAGRIISSVKYKSVKKNISYNFDGQHWRWSRFLTPGAENKFNNLPNFEKKRDKNIYVGMYASFSVKASDKDKDKLKFTWDFGDGHKSYLKNTRHKYEKAGKYTVILKIFDGSEEKIETFEIEVKKYPKAKMTITKISANPAGRDVDLEWLEIQNNSPKKVNLKGWSIATGSKKLYNHPITQELELKPGERLKITREICRFTLNNKKNKLELRYPNGKVADKVEYDKGKESVKDDEIYVKGERGWEWIKAQKETEEKRETAENDREEIKEENFGEFLDGQSRDNDEQKNKEDLLNYGTHIKLAVMTYNNHSTVLGAETVRLENNIYNFTQPINNKNQMQKIFKNIFNSINYLINTCLNNLVNFYKI